MPNQETEVEKAIKALEAALRKAEKAGVAVRAVYSYTDDDRVTHSENLKN